MAIPHQADLLAEQRLLQTLIYQPEFLDNITEDIFSTKSNRNIFNSIVSLHNMNIPLTRDSLCQEYLTRDFDGNTSTIDIISKPQNTKLSTIEDIITQLKDFKKRRETQIILEKLIKNIEGLSKLSEEDIDEIKIQLAEAEIAISRDSELNKKILNMGEWFDDYLPELNKRKLGKQYYFNNFIFDNLVIDGPRPGEIGLIVSSSGSGKSTAALNLVSDLIDNTIPNMYFSLEMSSISTLDRLCSKRTGIPYSDIIMPKEQHEFEAVIKAIEEEKNKLITNTKFRFSENASVSLTELYQHIRKFQADIKQTYCIVIIDLLSMVTDFCKNSTNMAQQIEIGINRLSAMAKELNIHVIGILQYNRGSEADAGKIRDVQDINKLRPNRAQIKNSNSWIERCRYAISTFRPKMFAEMYLEADDYADLPDIMTVSLIKCSNGQLKKIDALFNGSTFSVEPIEDTLSSEEGE
jgi:replicative DNA helicase